MQSLILGFRVLKTINSRFFFFPAYFRSTSGVTGQAFWTHNSLLPKHSIKELHPPGGWRGCGWPDPTHILQATVATPPQSQTSVTWHSAWPEATLIRYKWPISLVPVNWRCPQLEMPEMVFAGSREVQKRVKIGQGKWQSQKMLAHVTKMGVA